MIAFWGKGDRVERDLRMSTPMAGDEFVAALAGRVDVRRPSRRLSRLVFAMGVLVLTVGFFASFATAGYAAPGTTTSAADQYKAKKTIVVRSAVAKQTKPSVVKAAPAQAGGLPFTGISLAGTLVIGVGLIGFGVMLRRREQRDDG